MQTLGETRRDGTKHAETPKIQLMMDTNETGHGGVGERDTAERHEQAGQNAKGTEN